MYNLGRDVEIHIYCFISIMSYFINHVCQILQLLHVSVHDTKLTDFRNSMDSCLVIIYE
jgi:hypothetical protein